VKTAMTSTVISVERISPAFFAIRDSTTILPKKDALLAIQAALLVKVQTESVWHVRKLTVSSTKMNLLSAATANRNSDSSVSLVHPEEVWDTV
jgi:hypothetical protein